MSAGVEQILKPLFNFARAKAGKILYPGLPFLFVPTLVASLVVGQFSGNLAHYPSDQPTALDLPVRLSRESGERGRTTLLIVPTASDFFLRSAGKGINEVWLSIEPSKLRSNNERITLSKEGVELGPLRGVDYPLVLVVEGEHAREIDPVGRKPQPLSRLELVTASSNWIVFFLLGGAIFGFGASTGFVNDGSKVEHENSGIHKRHHKG